MPHRIHHPTNDRQPGEFTVWGKNKTEPPKDPSPGMEVLQVHSPHYFLLHQSISFPHESGENISIQIVTWNNSKFINKYQGAHSHVEALAKTSRIYTKKEILP